MKKSTAKIIIDLWNEKFAGSTDATKTKAVLDEPYPYADINRKDAYGVRIVPDGEDNFGDVFYHNEELTDVTRAFKVSSYIGLWEGKMYARLY